MESVSRRSPEVYVPFLGLLYGAVVLVLVGTGTGSLFGSLGAFAYILLPFALLFVGSAYLVWRRNRVGYVISIIWSVLFLLDFTFNIQDALTGFVDQPNFLETVTLLPVMVLTLVYSIIGARIVWRKGAMQNPPKMMRASTTLALLGVGFIVGAALIGALGAGLQARLLNAGTPGDITITQGAASGVNSYSPSTLTVKVGTTVTWVSKDSTTHTVTTQGSSLFDHTLSLGDTFSFKFTQAGTYQYYCTIHPVMKGTIVVTSG
jgi:plastocyanin